MAKEKTELVQMRVYLPAAKIQRVQRIADKREISVSAFLAELLDGHKPMSSISLPASRNNWRAISLRVPRDLYERLLERAVRMGARSWDLISAILLASIPKR